MADPTPETAPRLWTPSGFREDEWTHAESAEALAGNGRFILPLQAFLDLGEQERISARERLGVLLLPGDELDKIVGLLDQLSLVALAFPAFSDGRSFSKAELLRSRHGFEGAVRATGEVLVDQLPHMLRVGFDEFEVTQSGADQAAGGGRDRRNPALLPARCKARCQDGKVQLAPRPLTPRRKRAPA